MAVLLMFQLLRQLDFVDRWEGSITSETILNIQLLRLHVYVPCFYLYRSSAQKWFVYPKKMDDNNVLLIENGGRKAYVVDKTEQSYSPLAFP